MLIYNFLLGMVIAYAKGAFMPWRLVAWLNIIYTIVPVVLIQLFVPESPVWLVSKGRIEDAAKSLKFLYRAYPQPDHTVSNIFFSRYPFINYGAKQSNILKYGFLPFYITTALNVILDSNNGRYAFNIITT